jgi:hypothetical protein
MAGLVPAIHDWRGFNRLKSWMTGTRPVMTDKQWSPSPRLEFPSPSRRLQTVSARSGRRAIHALAAKSQENGTAKHAEHGKARMHWIMRSIPKQTFSVYWQNFLQKGQKDKRLYLNAACRNAAHVFSYPSYLFVNESGGKDQGVLTGLTEWTKQRPTPPGPNQEAVYWRVRRAWRFHFPVVGSPQPPDPPPPNFKPQQSQ